MKKPDLTHLLAAATLFLAGATTGAIAQSAAPGLQTGQRETLKARADLNGDGTIDESERAAVESKMRAKLSAEPRFLARADTDKDGQISDAEWTAAKVKFRAHARQAMKKEGQKMKPLRAGHHRNGKRAAEFRRGFLMGKYDLNGDHQLDETERAAMRTDMDTKMRAGLEKQLTRLKAVDADGDGKISDAEWAAAKAQFKNQHPNRDGQRQKGPRGPDRDSQPPPLPPAK